MYFTSLSANLAKILLKVIWKSLQKFFKFNVYLSLALKESVIKFVTLFNQCCWKFDVSVNYIHINHTIVHLELYLVHS